MTPRQQALIAAIVFCYANKNFLTGDRVKVEEDRSGNYPKFAFNGDATQEEITMEDDEGNNITGRYIAPDFSTIQFDYEESFRQKFEIRFDFKARTFSGLMENQRFSFGSWDTDEVKFTDDRPSRDPEAISKPLFQVRWG